ncbi:MAG: hypothetical protein R3350_09915 [Saprospiraceae bacterium]|nr:hypothetical protein [Saprospiraceae bacterium]
MAVGSIKIKVVKENNSTVTVHFMTLNRKMPVPRKDFEERVESGLYEVVNEDNMAESKG